MWRRVARGAVWVAAVSVGSATALVLAGTSARASYAASLPAPALVTSASASPGVVPASGGTVSVNGTVEHATTCQLELLSSQSFPVVYSRNPRSCTSGIFSARVTIGPNPTLVARTVAFALVASNTTSSFPGRFYVRLLPASEARVLAASAFPTVVPESGGTVTVTGAVEDATTCQLELLSSQSFPVVYSRDPRNCTSGVFSAKVTIGPNPGHEERTVALALVARNLASSSPGKFFVTLKAAPATPLATPPETTVVPTVSPPVSLSVTRSSNWSGYSAKGGPYTEVTGTFTVPSVALSAPLSTQVSQWVGLDGTSQSDSSLIQAGVDEFPDAQSPIGYDVQAWWEILPAAETNITTVNVSAGDRVTVTIWQVNPGTWRIELTDDTTGQSFATPDESYKGPGSSAEWIVEATTECQSSCHTASLAPFTPPVVFSGLGMSGPQATTVNDIVLVQGFNNVATPSPLSAGSFKVAYTGPPAATS